MECKYVTNPIVILRITKQQTTNMKYILFFLGLTTTISFAQVGIGTTTPNASSALEISSNNSGLLIPRLTNLERDAITLPATSLLIFNSTVNGYQFNFGTPLVPEWVPITTNSSTKEQSLKYSNTDISTDLNVGTPIDVPIFGTEVWNDNTTLYSVSGNVLTVNETGRYKIIINLHIDNREEAGIRIRIRLNTTLVGSYGISGAGEDGPNTTSINMIEVIHIMGGDEVAIETRRTGDNANIRMDAVGTSNFTIIN